MSHFCGARGRTHTGHPSDQDDKRPVEHGRLLDSPVSRRHPRADDALEDLGNSLPLPFEPDLIVPDRPQRPLHSGIHLKRRDTGGGERLHRKTLAH